ncbi:hypothetical protein AC579_7560 [Pseudocercospora musae]|uniref:Uncharacterized protein n=1 Tax=Pseudocercospora musae TaxID=113226 RepID=A0A139IHF2_9PEZI|nr:hypothetical protein AC579_7560 [Pseudocercospora musae]
MAASKPNGTGPTDSPMGAVHVQPSSGAPSHRTLPPQSHVPYWVTANRKPNIPDMRNHERVFVKGMRLVEDLYPSTIEEALDGTNYYLQVELGYGFKDPLDLRYAPQLKICGEKRWAADQLAPTSYTARLLLDIGIVKDCAIKDLWDRISRQLLTGVAEHLGKHELIERCAYRIVPPYALAMTEHALYNGPPQVWQKRAHTPGIWYLVLVEAAPRAADGLYDTIAGGRLISRVERDRLAQHLEDFEVQCWLCGAVLPLPCRGWVMTFCGEC